jgi:hypothetical protein
MPSSVRSERGRRVLSRVLVGAVVAGVAIVPSVLGAGTSAAAETVPRPIVVDLDLTPEPACDGPVRGRLAVYHPSGVAAGASVEWRVRLDGASLATGTVPLGSSLVNAEFEVPAERVPDHGGLLIDARAVAADGTPAEYGEPWRDQLSRGCDPLRVVSVGDSVVWDQGLRHDQKFPRRVAATLGAATGRGARHLDYSISGAVLDSPDLPAGNDDTGCLGERYAQDPDDDGEMELGEVTQQLPDVFCQLERAGANARRDGHGIDLVLMNGCINDLDPFLGVAAAITPGSEDVPAGVRRECTGEGAAAVNPAKDVPYFSGAKLGYGGRGMRAAIDKAHALPGHPKVLVVDFYYALTRASLGVLTRQCEQSGLAAERVPQCRGAVRRGADRFEQYTRYSAEAYRAAAAEVNAASPDGPFAAAGDGLFTLDNAVLAPESLLWSSPTADPAYPLRRQACPEFSATVPQCLTAGLAHPDVDGAARYADSLALNPALLRWFGLAAPRPPLDVSAGDTAGDRTLTVPAGPAGSRYQWYFGDGTTAGTDTPTTRHRTTEAGPQLPRAVVTAPDGARTLYEADAPIVG